MARDLQKEAAKEFAKKWKDKGNEQQHKQVFWLELMKDVYGDENIADHIAFEVPVRNLKTTEFKDIEIYNGKDTILIEQKSIGTNLDNKQPGHKNMTPFEQAENYSMNSDVQARWVIVSNFAYFRIHDMHQDKRARAKPVAEIPLSDLPKRVHEMDFLVNYSVNKVNRETELSIAAGDIVGELYDAFSKQYVDLSNKHSVESLNKLCVRIVFCLYAEDAGLFKRKNQFHDFLEPIPTSNMRQALMDLFNVLDTEESKRDPYMDQALLDFPYVNGGLFKDDDKAIEIPRITDEIKQLLLAKASDGFNWSEISPTIFGAVFESTLNPETRRAGGMHYTSIENIHKVIDPLFLDELKEELKYIKSLKTNDSIDKNVDAFQNKLASLKFLDPAAGSGNFLTETYICLRNLENEALYLKYSNRAMLAVDDMENLIKVSISQFYGIEINDFAVSVAQTALWIAESQMMAKTEELFYVQLDFLPLKTYAHIYEGNALRMDWNDIIPASELNYIMGNPPFLGYGLQTTNQKYDLMSLYVDENGRPYKAAGKIDYVAGWYMKSCQYMYGTKIEAALVSTNSITQGEQVSSIWEPLYKRYELQINFAYRTFIWDSEASIKAHVHCVIVGFSCYDKRKEKTIYDNHTESKVSEISPYLIEAPVTWIHSRSKPLCTVPEMTTGNRPADGGHLIIEGSDYDAFIRKEPDAKPYIKPFVGSEDYINGKTRYCLWLVGVSPDKLQSLPEVLKRVEACRADRLNGAPDRIKLADKPMLFRETKNPKSYIIVPRHSSEKRRYIPLGFLDDKFIPADSAVIIPDAKEYEFGILTSNVHMTWVSIVCGRLKSDYRYSKDIVYNNFPWPEPSPAQKAKIEHTAQNILSARNSYAGNVLADMYGEHMYLYPDLIKAHEANDKAVMEAYGFREDMTESEIVAELMKMYQKLVSSNSSDLCENQ